MLPITRLYANMIMRIQYIPNRVLNSSVNCKINNNIYLPPKCYTLMTSNEINPPDHNNNNCNDDNDNNNEFDFLMFYMFCITMIYYSHKNIKNRDKKQYIKYKQHDKKNDT